MKKSLIFVAVSMFVFWGFQQNASASCEFSSGPCTQDSAGHTYQTEQALGGGYKTTRDGNSYSTTSQTLSGDYKTNYNDGRSEIHNYDPYKSNRSSGSSGFGSSNNSYR